MTLQHVYIVRHGETDYNLTGRWQGTLDVPLNSKGREQAQATAGAFAGIPIGKIYASDLSRAFETAKAIANANGVTSIHTDTRLREISVGVFQGLTREQIAETYPLEFNYWQNSDSYVVPQGESRLQLQARAYAFWQEVIETDTTPHIVVVTHGGTIRWLLGSIFSQETTLGKHLENTSITTLQRVEGRWLAYKVGDTSHLESAPKPSGGNF
jgi:broad specificity phosphatase PhoE